MSSSNQNKKPNSSHDHHQDEDHPTPDPASVEQTELDPAVERGERIDTGKQIARAGKTNGPVPGAESSPPKK